MPDFPLEKIAIASPCSADWSTMIGDNQKRFCQQCQLNVYNLSGMSREAAETLIQESDGQLCVRFFRRPDGTLLTQDCPVGVKALYRRKLRRLNQVAAVVTVMTLAGLFYIQSASALEPHPVNVTMGEALAPSALQPLQGGLVPVKPPESEKLIPPAQKRCKSTKKSSKTVKKPPIKVPPPATPTQEPKQASMGKVAAPKN